MNKQPSKQMDRNIEEKIFKKLNKKDGELSDYSTNIEHAYSVRDELIKTGIVTPAGFQAYLDKYIFQSKMPAHAICLSCLEIIGEPTTE